MLSGRDLRGAPNAERRLHAATATIVALVTLAAPLGGCGDDGAGTDPLTVRIAAPQDGTVVDGPTEITVEVTPDDESAAVVLGTDARRLSRDDGTIVFEWTPSGGAGSYVVEATATREGAVATDAITLAYHPDYDPLLQYCAPNCAAAPDEVDGEGVLRFELRIAGPLRGDDATVTWTVGDEVAATATAYPYGLDLDTSTLGEGRHTLRFDFAPAQGQAASGETTIVTARCDRDQDGYDAVECGGDDCDDDDFDTNPGTAEVCDGRSQDCDDEVDEGATCSGDDVCIAGDCVPGACTAAGLPCGPSSTATWPFDCDLDAGICVQRCALDHPIPSRACPSGASCRAASSAAALGEGEGWCVRAECTGVDGLCGDDVCVPFDFGFGECAAPGAGGVGDACGVPTRTDDPLAQDCAPDLECFAGRCVDTCDPATPSCAIGQACVRVWDSVRPTPAGVCLSPCDSFSDVGCSDGFACQPVADYAFSQSTSWACVPAPDGAVPAGEPCVPGEDVCASGTHCTGVTGPNAAVFRCQPACDTGEFGYDCGDGFRCAPTPGEALGTCVEECDPMPRRGTGNYGCADDGDTCHPLLGGGGACLPDTSTRAVGDACPEPRSFGACPDDGYCTALALDGDGPTCHRLCALFDDEPGCGTGEVCNPRPLLDGKGAIGVCDPAPLATPVGAACSTPGRACAEHGTLCVDTGDGAECRRACAGPVDCGDQRCLWSLPLVDLLVRGQAGVCGD